MNFLSILILIFSPLIMGLAILSPIFPTNKILIRRTAKTFAIIHFIYSLLFLAFYNSTNLGWSYQKELTLFGASWLKSLGISATFAMDGISLAFILLTSFITMLVIILSKTMIRTKHRLFYPLVLSLQTIILGTFCAKDLFLFFLFWQAELIVSYFLISQWEEKKATPSCSKYLIYNTFGGVILLLGLLVLYFYNFAQNGILTGDMESINIPDGIFAFRINSLIFWWIFIGLATKFAIFPLHSGMLNAQVNASTPVSILLNSLILNMGGYGIIRFNVEIFPDLFNFWNEIIIIIGIINILYGAVLALYQTDIKKMVAYLNLTQCGLILIGLCTLTEIGFEGALFHIISKSIIISGLFALIGSIYLRTKTREISQLGGLRQVLPICYNLGILIFLGSIFSPFTCGFVSEFMILNGIILSEYEPNSLLFFAIIICLLGLLINIACILKLFNKTFYGEIMAKFKYLQPKRAITKSEIIVLALIGLSIIFLGLFPNSVLEIFDSTSDVIIDFLKV